MSDRKCSVCVRVCSLSKLLPGQLSAVCLSQKIEGKIIVEVKKDKEKGDEITESEDWEDWQQAVKRIVTVADDGIRKRNHSASSLLIN